MEMETKKYKISSVADLWESSVIEVDKKGFICRVEPLSSSIVVGSKFESMKAFWESFEGESAYKIEELKNESV